jgi:hypothetical protein
MVIRVMNSTQTDPQIHIGIYKPDSTNYKQYIVTLNEPKQVIDLTADLAAVREGKEIVSAQFSPAAYGGDVDIYSKDCDNILSNVFISYTYDE